MKKLSYSLLIVVPLVLLAAFMISAAPDLDEQSIRDLDEAYRQAWVKGCIGELKWLMAPEFIHTSNRGELVTKDEDLALIISGEVDVTSGKSTEVKVRLYGHVAIVTGLWEAEGTWSGQPFQEALRYTSVWVQHDGTWQIVADQATNIADSVD